MAAVTVSMLGLTVIAPLIPHYMNTMGIGGFGIGALFASFSLTRIVVTPFIGARSDRTEEAFHMRRAPPLRRGLASLHSGSYHLSPDPGQDDARLLRLPDHSGLARLCR